MSMQPYQPYPHLTAVPGRSPVLHDQRSGGAHTAEVVCAWLLTVGTLGYMLPWAVAASRGKSNSAAVAVVNLLTGWTFIGWIAALVMACGAHQTVATQSVVVNVAGHQTPPPGWYPDGPVLRYWDGRQWTDHTAAPNSGPPPLDGWSGR